jgi:DNA-binding Xre family transcriptional regulator
MPRKIVRVQRQTRLSATEAQALNDVRNRIADELPSIKARARALLAETRAVGKVCSALRAAREARGFTLGDIERITGIDRSALSKLERGERPNVTFETLGRYAAALGKRLRVELEGKIGDGSDLP